MDVVWRVSMKTFKFWLVDREFSALECHVIILIQRIESREIAYKTQVF
jgi:hypothetical protein